MNKLTAFAAVTIATTYTSLAVYLVGADKLVVLTVLTLLYLTGLLIRRTRPIWRLSALFHASLALLFMFRVFGGLEPNSPGSLSQTGWLSLEVFLFVLFVVSTALSALQAHRSEMGGSGLHPTVDGKE